MNPELANLIDLYGTTAVIETLIEICYSREWKELGDSLAGIVENIDMPHNPPDLPTRR